MLRVQEKIFPWRGSEQASPKCSTLASGLFWAKDNQGPEDSGRVFNLLLNCLKESRLSAWLRCRAVTRDNFYQKDQSVWQGKHLITKHLLFLSSCESPSSPLKPQVAIPFLSSRWYISFNCQDCPWISLSLWGSHTNIIKCIFFSLASLSYVDLIIKPVKEHRRTEENLYNFP